MQTVGLLGEVVLRPGVQLDTVAVCAVEVGDVVHRPDWINGDLGTNTLTGGHGADTFHAFSGSGIDRVTDFNAAEGDRVQLDPGTTYSVHQSGADTVVDLGGGDQVILVGVQANTLPSGWLVFA